MQQLIYAGLTGRRGHFGAFAAILQFALIWHAAFHKIYIGEAIIPWSHSNITRHLSNSVCIWIYQHKNPNDNGNDESHSQAGLATH